jgi:hypothetical protein
MMDGGDLEPGAAGIRLGREIRQRKSDECESSI